MSAGRSHRDAEQRLVHAVDKHLPVRVEWDITPRRQVAYRGTYIPVDGADSGTKDARYLDELKQNVRRAAEALLPNLHPQAIMKAYAQLSAQESEQFDDFGCAEELLEDIETFLRRRHTRESLRALEQFVNTIRAVNASLRKERA